MKTLKQSSCLWLTANIIFRTDIIIVICKDFHAMYHKDKALTIDCSVDKNTLHSLIQSLTYVEKDRPGDYEP